MTAGIVTLNQKQFRALLLDQLDGKGPCRIREDTSLATLQSTLVVPNARIFMSELQANGATLTAKGNLNRKAVEALMTRLQWDGCDAAKIRAVSPVVNEHDFIPAMYLHALLRLAGLVRSQKGSLKLTRKGESLLPEDAAGRLQASLFRTNFTKFNCAYLDPIDRPNVFAPQISLVLCLIGQLCKDWCPCDALMRGVALPAEDLAPPLNPRLPVWAFEARVLRYLCWFGLMEDTRPAANDDWQQPRLYRKTPLYDDMLSFAMS